MNEANFLSCLNLITKAHNCQMYVGDETLEVEGTIAQNVDKDSKRVLIINNLIQDRLAYEEE